MKRVARNSVAIIRLLAKWNWVKFKMKRRKISLTNECVRCIHAISAAWFFLAKINKHCDPVRFVWFSHVSWFLLIHVPQLFHRSISNHHVYGVRRCDVTEQTYNNMFSVVTIAHSVCMKCIAHLLDNVICMVVYLSMCVYARNTHSSSIHIHINEHVVCLITFSRSFAVCPSRLFTFRLRSPNHWH